MLAKQYLLQDGYSIKGSGQIGPYTSQETLINEKKQSPSSILLNNYNNNMINEKNHVRFKDDSNQQSLPRLINNNYSNDPTDLRYLKDSVNQFNSRFRPQTTTTSSSSLQLNESPNNGLPVLNISNRSAKNDDNDSYRSSSNNYERVLETINITPTQPNNQEIFSITQNSYRVPSTSQRPTTSIENIYSQVQPKQSNNYNPKQQQQQPVYMNTGYMNQKSQNDYTNWNDDSV